jgi:hypothetical protein
LESKTVINLGLKQKGSVQRLNGRKKRRRRTTTKREGGGG